MNEDFKKIKVIMNTIQESFPEQYPGLMDALNEDCSIKSAEKYLENNLKEQKKEIVDQVNKEMEEKPIMLDTYNIRPLMLAQKFIQLRPHKYDKSKIFWRYNQKQYKWQKIDETDILNHIKHHLTQTNITQQKFVNELLMAMKIEARDYDTEEIEPHHVQFKDKIINLKSGEERKVRPKDFTFYSLPWNLSSSSETPTLDKLFKEWVGDKASLLYDVLALSCCPEHFMNHFFILYGSGSNGKSVFINLVRRFIGISNTCTTTLENLTGNNFGTSRLCKKLACFISETNLSNLKNTSILKQLTGEDPISYEFKGKDSFDGVNTATIIIATNNVPTINDRTDGFYRRPIIIDFPNTFDGKVDVLSMVSDEELECLARKCVDRLLVMRKNKRLSIHYSVDELRKDYESRSNPLVSFCRDFCVEDLDSYISKADFEKIFLRYCKKNKHRRFSRQEINLYMRGEGYGEIVRENGLMGENRRFKAWDGIRWKNADE